MFPLGQLIIGNRGGAAPFSPTDIPGLVAWYNSENCTLVGGNADTLIDLSGNGHTATCPSAGQRPVPVFGDPVFNGHASLTWSNAAGSAMITPALSLGAYMIVTVARITSTTAGYIYEWSAGDFLFSQTLYSLYTAVRDGSGASAWDVGANWAASANPRTFTRRMDGTHAGDTLRINGVDQVMTPQLANDPGTAPYSTSLGILCSHTGTSSSDGKWAATLIYDNVPSDPNRDALEDYLRVYYAHY